MDFILDESVGLGGLEGVAGGLTELKAQRSEVIQVETKRLKQIEVDGSRTTILVESTTC